MDAVFKALADPTRRSLLDTLYERDGQTLSALEARLPMTRFGVMKHLRVLEEANLVTTKRRGREKLHFLNPVPIRLVHDRWVSKYAEPWAAALSGLKTTTGGTVMEDDSKRVSWADGTAPVADGTAVFEVFIKTTPERLWEAITDPELRAKYSFGVGTSSDWTDGVRVHGRHPRGRRHRGRREPGGRPAAAARAELHRAVERRGEGRGAVDGDLGDRAGRHLVPADRHPLRPRARTPTPSSTAAGR